MSEITFRCDHCGKTFDLPDKCEGFSHVGCVGRLAPVPAAPAPEATREAGDTLDTLLCELTHAHEHYVTERDPMRRRMLKEPYIDARTALASYVDRLRAERAAQARENEMSETRTVPLINDAEAERFYRHAEDGARAEHDGVEYALIQPYDLQRFARTVQRLRAGANAWEEYASHLEHCQTCAEDGMDACWKGSELGAAARAATTEGGTTR